jgi:hypothetical protein
MLRSLQAQFRAASVRGNAPALAAIVVGAGIDPARRLQIHHNHMRATLTDALAATFPTVFKLVGEDFFRMLAHGFIAVEPPAAPCLFDYGAQFPDYIAVNRACRELPYLPDAARFDWLINVAYHAPDRTALVHERLAALAPELFSKARLVPHPATALLESPYPLLDIWQVARADSDAAPVDLDAGGVQLLVYRSDLDVRWRVLNQAEYAFLDAATRGRPLAEAWECALDVDLAEGAAQHALATALALDLFTDLTVAEPRAGADPTVSIERTLP